MECGQPPRLPRPSSEGAAPGPVLPASITLCSRTGTRSARGRSTFRSSSSSPGPQAAKRAGVMCWCPGLWQRRHGPKTEPRAWVTAAVHLPVSCIACCQLSSVRLGSLFPCIRRWVNRTLLGQVSPWVQDTGRCYHLLAQGKRDVSCSQCAICSPPRAQVCHLLEEGADGEVEGCDAGGSCLLHAATHATVPSKQHFALTRLCPV